SSSVYTSQASKVISVQTQVVAGMKYIFTIEMARTSCKKGKSQPICTIHSDPAIAQPHICKAHREYLLRQITHTHTHTHTQSEIMSSV
ncbi:cystatin family protein, partial [Herbaspirillum rubrisubalbicans]|uniref:cystatin family protein n=1 Tax=Herbaspirillum rubrisubalbicans TaxID=80842 RepID=UPI0012F68615